MSATEFILVASTRRRIAASSILLFPGVYWYFALYGGPKDRTEMLTFAAVFTVVAAYFVAITALARWRYDDLGIERLTPLTRRVRVAWSDVTSIRGGPWRSLVLSGHFPKSVAVPSALAGSDELQHFILHHFPEVLSDLTRRLLELRFGGAIAIPVDAPEPDRVDEADRAARWRANPFFVLGLSPECSRADVERTGQKLLALLAIDSGPAKRAVTPLGEIDRTVDTVRGAMAELRDPERRLSHEAWARLSERPDSGAEGEAREEAARPWTDAMAAFGFRGP